ncbi:MAG TPA: nitrilase-related carbon-nitrogen hydrolase [Ktedonobacterales bacterium]|jgi:apolipoprotein N-acyltransferase
MSKRTLASTPAKPSHPSKASQRNAASPRAVVWLPYLWLALAAILYLFSSVRWVIPLAAWFAPLLLLRFVRSQRPLPGVLLAWLARAIVAAIALQGIILYPAPAYYPLVVILALVTVLPFLADRLMAPRLAGYFGGFLATLVFPVAYTTIEYLSSFGPFGTITSLANTQYGDLPLLQLLSVTGIWGITFLITWFASVGNWAWEHNFAWPQMRRGGALYAGILALVLLGGSARLTFAPPQATTVRVAGLSASRAAVAAFNQQLSPAAVSRLAAGTATAADRTSAHAAFAALDAGLLTRSQQEADAGAKIVVWPEASPTGAAVLREDESALIQQAGALAQQSGIYLDMGLAVYLPSGGNGPFVEDQAVLLDPTGSTAWTYEKTRPAPGEQGVIVLGNGKVPLVATPYGRLANVICFDADFPGLVRQAGQNGADLLLVPSDDWQAIDPAHSQDATFRAIENGFSLVRESSKGLSLAVDYEGHVLAASDYFTTDDQVMVAAIPMRGVHTIYAAIGDLFAWLCLLGLLAFIGLSIATSRPRSPAYTAAPVAADQATE